MGVITSSSIIPFCVWWLAKIPGNVLRVNVWGRHRPVICHCSCIAGLADPRVRVCLGQQDHSLSAPFSSH